MSGFWGTQTYSAGDRVPLQAVRCQSKPADGKKRHACRQHGEHIGDHRCICGERWAA